MQYHSELLFTYEHRKNLIYIQFEVILKMKIWTMVLWFRSHFCHKAGKTIFSRNSCNQLQDYMISIKNTQFVHHEKVATLKCDIPSQPHAGQTGDYARSGKFIWG